MATRIQQATLGRWVLVFLAAMVVALAAILLGNLPPAQATGDAENRVRAISVSAEPRIGPSEHITAGLRLGNDGQRVVDAVATGVAANTVTRAPQVLRVGELKLPGVPKGATGTPSSSGGTARCPLGRAGALER
jgi:hypothetical protein